MAQQEFSPQAARQQAARIGTRVRSAARWHGWMWLTIAILTPTFLLGTGREDLPRSIQFWIAVGFGLVGAVLTVWEARRGVVGRQAARVDRPMTWAYVVLMMVAIGFTFIGDQNSPWFIPLALAPSIPCLLAAWRVLRA